MKKELKWLKDSLQTQIMILVVHPELHFGETMLQRLLSMCLMSQTSVLDLGLLIQGFLIL